MRFPNESSARSGAARRGVVVVVAMLLVAVPASATLLACARRGFPMLGGDAACFVPAAVWWSRSGEFSNPIYPNAWSYDPAARFIYYPPLFEWVLRRVLAFLSGPSGPVLAVGVVSVAAVLAHVAALAACERRRGDEGDSGGSSAGRACAAAVSVAALFAVVMSVWGRPESVAMILMAPIVPLLLVPRATPGGRWRGRAALVAMALLAGLVATAQLILAAKVMILVLMLDRAGPGERWWRRQGVAIAVAAATFLAGMALLSPFPLLDSARGITEHAARVVLYRPERWPFLLVGTLADLPGYGLLHAILLVTLATLARRRVGPGLAERGWRWFLGLTLIALEARYTLLQPELSYNSAPLLMLAVPAADALVAGTAAGAWPRRLRVGVLLLAALLGLGSVRQMILAVDAARSGVGLEEARGLLAEAELPGVIGMTYGLWPLVDDLPRVRTITVGPDGGVGGTEPEYLVVQQFSHSNVRAIPGYRVLLSRRLGGPVRLLGSLPLANSPMGYQFTIHARESPDPAGAAPR